MNDTAKMIAIEPEPQRPEAGEQVIAHRDNDNEVRIANPANEVLHDRVVMATDVIMAIEIARIEDAGTIANRDENSLAHAIEIVHHTNAAE